MSNVRALGGGLANELLKVCGVETTWCVEDGRLGRIDYRKGERLATLTAADPAGYTVTIPGTQVSFHAKRAAKRFIRRFLTTGEGQ